MYYASSAGLECRFEQFRPAAFRRLAMSQMSQNVPRLGIPAAFCRRRPGTFPRLSVLGRVLWRVVVRVHLAGEPRLTLYVRARLAWMDIRYRFF
jgi:hypothetical protein